MCDRHAAHGRLMKYIAAIYVYPRADLYAPLDDISYLDGIGGHRRYATNETSYAAGFR